MKKEKYARERLRDIMWTRLYTKDLDITLAVGIGCFIGYTLLAVLDAVLIRR